MGGDQGDLGSVGDERRTLRKWVRQAEVDAGEAAGVTSPPMRELRELRRKNRELEQLSKSLRLQQTFFARECDPLYR